MTDLATFARRIRIQANRVEPGSDQAVVDCSSAVARELVESTPADTGRAITNWDAAVGRAPISYKTQAAVPGTKGNTRESNVALALARMLAAIRAYRRGQSVHITNSAPYIEKLNAGSSLQAPAGFIEAAIQRGRAVIRNVRIFR